MYVFDHTAFLLYFPSLNFGLGKKECVLYLFRVGMFPLQSNNIDYWLVSVRHQLEGSDRDQKCVAFSPN